MKVTGGQNWEIIMMAKLLFLSYFCPGPAQPGPQPTSKSKWDGEPDQVRVSSILTGVSICNSPCLSHHSSVIHFCDMRNVKDKSHGSPSGIPRLSLTETGTTLFFQYTLVLLSLWYYQLGESASSSLLAANPGTPLLFNTSSARQLQAAIKISQKIKIWKQKATFRHRWPYIYMLIPIWMRVKNHQQSVNLFSIPMHAKMEIISIQIPVYYHQKSSTYGCKMEMIQLPPMRALEHWR